MGDDPLGWSLDPEEKWGNPLERDGKAREVVEKDINLQYQGYGNERLLVLGSSFVCDPEIELLLDREITTTDDTLRSYSPGTENIGDIVVSRNLWDNIDQDVKKILDRNPVMEDHYPVNFRETGSNGDRYAGFLRVEDETGYDVALETQSGSQTQGTLQGYPMA